MVIKPFFRTVCVAMELISHVAKVLSSYVGLGPNVHISMYCNSRELAIAYTNSTDSRSRAIESLTLVLRAGND